MDNLLGGLAGAVTGTLGAFVAAILQITAKRLRNARFVQRGEPPAKDLVFSPAWLLLGIVGFIAGLCWTWQLDGTWLTGAIAGAIPPGIALVAWLVAFLLLQLRR